MRSSEDIPVDLETRNGALVLRPHGDIDLSRAPSLRQHLSAAQGKKPDRLVIDLSGVPYMDSSGVATLVEAMQNARRGQTKLILCALQQKVQSIFEIARLDMVFTIVPNCDDALSV